MMVMVCEITMRSKKYESSRPELLALRSGLTERRDELVSLSAEDAMAYDLVVAAARNRKAKPGDASEKGFQAALKHASEVPQKTAAASLKVLETAIAVAGLGIRSAKSDVGVAVHLARAGFEGAVMNVSVNLDGISDQAFVKSARERIDAQNNQARSAARKALEVLSAR